MEFLFRWFFGLRPEELRPTWHVINLLCISAERLRVQGIRVGIVDFDQTLWNKLGHVDRNNARGLRHLNRHVLEDIVVVSNSALTNRVKREKWIREVLAEEEIYPKAIICLSGLERKPRPDGLLRALKILDAEPHEAVMIGDQMLSDILAAIRAKIASILVEPVGFYAWRSWVSGRVFTNWFARKWLHLKPLN